MFSSIATIDSGVYWGLRAAVPGAEVSRIDTRSRTGHVANAASGHDWNHQQLADVPVGHHEDLNYGRQYCHIVRQITMKDPCMNSRVNSIDMQ